MPNKSFIPGAYVRCSGLRDNHGGNMDIGFNVKVRDYILDCDFAEFGNPNGNMRGLDKIKDRSLHIYTDN